MSLPRIILSFVLSALAVAAAFLTVSVAAAILP
jgi:hypothetical protein